MHIGHSHTHKHQHIHICPCFICIEIHHPSYIYIKCVYIWINDKHYIQYTKEEANSKWWGEKEDFTSGHCRPLAALRQPFETPWIMGFNCLLFGLILKQLKTVEPVMKMCKKPVWKRWITRIFTVTFQIIDQLINIIGFNCWIWSTQNDELWRCWVLHAGWI